MFTEGTTVDFTHGGEIYTGRIVTAGEDESVIAIPEGSEAIVAHTQILRAHDTTGRDYGMDLTTVEGVAQALRFAGVEIGSVGGENVRLHYAKRLLPLLDAKFAAVWREAYFAGVVDERTSCEVTDSQIPPSRSNPYEATK